MDAASGLRPRPARVGLVGVVVLVLGCLLAGPVGMGRVSRLGQADTFDLLSPTERPHPAPAERPPRPAWTYVPDGEVLASDRNLARLYLLQRQSDRLEVVSVDLHSGREAWRRTLVGATAADVEADAGQVLVTTIGPEDLTAAPGSGPGAEGGARAGAQETPPVVEQGHRVTAYDEVTADQRWMIRVRAGETHASVGSWVVVAPRYADDGTVEPGTVRVFDRRRGRAAWARDGATTIDAFREDLAVADGRGTAVLALRSGAEWDRFGDIGGPPPRLVGAHELAVPTSGGLMYSGRGGSSTSYVRVDGLKPASLQPVGEHLTLLDAGRGTMAIDRRTMRVVPLGPADAPERHVLGRGDEVRLLFGSADRLVAVDADGGRRRERRFDTGGRSVAGFAGWLVYLCEGTAAVAAYDVRTLEGVWRVRSAARPAGTCDVAPVPGGFLAVDEQFRIVAYR